ncbi:hypothetical protein JL720_16533 [Aureococcus anophagefferens]|nr:hypothetical protein JL720_16533 [Aureococcus anophagefferens]
MGEQMDCEVSDDGSGGASSHALEVKLNKRLALLEKLKDVDVHTACWGGDVDLVRAHLDFAGQGGGVRAPRAPPASKRLAALSEAATMATKRAAANDGEADECEIAVRAASAAARAEAANALDDSEFGEGYRPLHYAAYAGHAQVVEVLLEAGARVDERNAAGCTPLFLAAQQGRGAVVRLLYDRDPATNCASRHELVPTGDGRMLCALDVALRTAAAGATTRGPSCSTRSARRRAATPPAPALVPATTPTPARRRAAWRRRGRRTRTPAPGRRDFPPVHHAKVKVLRADDVDGDPAALVVVRAAAHRARIPAHAAGGKGVLEPGALACRLAADGAGAGAYSEPSAPATAAEPLAAPARAAAKKRPRIRGDAGTPHGKMAVRTSMDEEENRLADAARYDTPKNLAASRDDATTDGSDAGDDPVRPTTPHFVS